MDALDCILTRRSGGRLTEPAPSGGNLATLLAAAAAAPDHGLLRPWRFIVLRGHALHRLGEVFAKAEEARGAEAGTPVPEDALARTRGKPLRAPLIVALIATATPPRSAPTSASPRTKPSWAGSTWARPNPALPCLHAPSWTSPP